MGAQQAYQWAASHPTMVERIAPFCGTAKTTPHNAVFLQGLRAALTADAAWMGGDYGEQPVLGMRAFSRVYAGWGLSQPFYKRELWRQMGFDSLADFLTGFWEKRYGRRDANNLLSMIRTWELNDLGATPGLGGNLEHALGAIKAKATIMAGQTDLYFTVEDMKAEAAYVPEARFRVIPSSGGTWRAQASTRPTRGSSNAKSKRSSRFDQALMREAAVQSLSFDVICISFSTSVVLRSLVPGSSPGQETAEPGHCGKIAARSQS
jgi:pimeloyl-ACP methyl ester carboxylesterase